MKKFLFLVTLLYTLTGTFSYGQNEFYDALRLRKLLQNGLWPTDDAPVVEILNKYVDLDSGETIKSELRDNNPFLAPYLSTWASSAGPQQKEFTSIADLG